MSTQHKLSISLEELTLSSLICYQNNPRKNDKAVDSVAASIKEFGFLVPMVIDDNNEIVCGHTRYKAAMKLGMDTVPCIRAKNLTEAQIKAFRIADNSTAAIAEWDFPLLAIEVKSIYQEIDLKPFNINVDKLLAVDEKTQEVKDTEPFVGETNLLVEKYGVEPGSVFQCGKHRVMCGDSTMPADVKKLIGNNKINMLLTDPPYGCDYSGKNEFLDVKGKGNKVKTDIKNDKDIDYRTFFGEFLACVPFADYNTMYIFMSGQSLHYLRLALDDCKCTWGDYLVWNKNNFVLGRKDYNSKHEAILYGWKGKHKFYGTNCKTVIDFDKPHKSDLHPTMKPVELLTKLISDGSTAEDKVYDAFLGSGSTMIACENLGRQCFGMELSPEYVAVTLQRYETHTGIMPSKITE